MRTSKSHHWKSKLYNDKIKLTWFHWMISFIWACIFFGLNLMSAPRWLNASTEINMNEQVHNLSELTNDQTEAEHAYSFICVLFPLQFNAIEINVMIVHVREIGLAWLQSTVTSQRINRYWHFRIVVFGLFVEPIRGTLIELRCMDD